MNVRVYECVFISSANGDNRKPMSKISFFFFIVFIFGFIRKCHLN